MTIRRIVPNISSNKLAESKEFYIGFPGLTLAMDMKWVLTFASGSNPTAQITIVQSDKSDNISSNITLSIEVSTLTGYTKKRKSLTMK
jgi:hypothetical protein